MSAIQILAISALATSAPFAQTSEGWPHFQGPNRDGVVGDSNWSTQGAEEPLWSVNVGLGSSCPSIVGGRLVTMGFDEEAGLDHVVCLDAGTGEELWRHSYRAAHIANYHGGGTLTTPAIADGVVYTSNREGRVFALELDNGEVIWERDYREELGLAQTFHGYSASPLVLDGRIVFVFGGVVATAKREGGEVIWRTKDHGDGGYSNPIPFELRGRTCVAAIPGKTFLVVDVETGEVVHEHPWDPGGSGVNVAAPLVMGDKVFLSTAYDKGCALLRLGVGLEPEVLWETRRMRNKVTGCFLFGDHIYGFDESMLKCIDLEGNEAWRVRGLGMGALSIVGGRLLVLSSKGELIVAEATPEEYRELSRRKVLDDGVYWTMPVPVDGRIYARNSLGDLVCLDHRVDTRSGGVETSASVSNFSVPDAISLFSGHSRAIGGRRLREHSSVRLTGEVEILGRGLTRSPMTLTLAAPDRWQFRLSEGVMVHSYDGETGWKARNWDWNVSLFDASELLDAGQLFALPAAFAPASPRNAAVASEPVLFGGVTCWRVDSESSERASGAATSVTHYFDVESGLLIGREGGAISTMIYADYREWDGVSLPGRVIRYLPENGQEETYFLQDAEWGSVEEKEFDRPLEVLRLLRTPEEITATNASLRERFAAEIGRYRADFEPFDGGTIELLVEDGDLRLDFAGLARRRVDEDSEEAGRFQVLGRFSSKISFERDEEGKVTGMGLVRRGTEDFLPRID